MTKPDNTVSPVVTQADREAAKWLLIWQAHGFEGKYARRVGEGGCDRDDVVQAFARHREAERERCAKVAEGFEDASREWLPRSVWENIKRDTARRIRETPHAE